MFTRTIQTELKKLATEFPVVTITGPRQAGKTTLARNTFETYQYSNLENPEIRHFATDDPNAYLKQLKGPCIIDEIQRVPHLLSYIQVLVDEDKQVGQYILTGSHQLELEEAVTQSLAGRTGLLKLLPLSISELLSAEVEFDSFEQYCINGFMPRTYDQKIRPQTMFSNYYQTYVERDLKQLIKIKDITLFEKFIKLLAGRVGQLIDYNSLSNDVGVDNKTIKNWLSILEASFIIFKLTPYFENFGKRVIKSPKYYFLEPGLLSYLLNIETPEQLSRDPLVGNIFENLIVTECLKARYNLGLQDNLYFYRDSNKNEVDIIFENGRNLTPIEIKSASTFNTKFIKNLKKFKTITERSSKGYLIYNGDFTPDTNDYSALNYKQTTKIFE